MKIESTLSKLTETDKRQIRYQIAQLLRTRPNYIYIDRVEATDKPNEKKVYVVYKDYYRYGGLVREGSIVQIWAEVGQ